MRPLVTCYCRAGDGTDECERTNECAQAWYEGRLQMWRFSADEESAQR